MATEKYKKAIEKVMERVRSMRDDEFLELIRSQEGELGQVFDAPIAQRFWLSHRIADPKQTWKLDFALSDEFLEYKIEAANDNEYALAA